MGAKKVTTHTEVEQTLRPKRRRNCRIRRGLCVHTSGYTNSRKGRHTSQRLLKGRTDMRTPRDVRILAAVAGLSFLAGSAAARLHGHKGGGTDQADVHEIPIEHKRKKKGTKSQHQTKKPGKKSTKKIDA
jgi:hypothetical protein